MKFIKGAGIILALAYLQGAFAQTPDTVWLCREDTSEYMYSHMYLSDTSPDNRGAFNMVDTGDALEGKYINFDYQFGNPHPGYAGFKIFWDYGVSSFWVSYYDSMIFYHKGPLPGHKVRMMWAQGSAGIGTPINYEYFGEFKSSSFWKRESFSFPPGFVKTGLFELRMLIYNDSIAGDTSSTSAKGDLKLDKMYFYKGPARALVIQTQPQSQTVQVGSHVTFTVVTSGSTPNYQWQKDGVPITGAILPTYTIASATSSDAGSYNVVVTNSLGNVTSNTATLTVSTSPGIPVLASPTNGAGDQQLTVELSWGSVARATSYAVQASTDLNFGSTGLSQTGLTATATKLSGFANGVMYYWRVNASNSGGTGAWAAAWSFTTYGLPVLIAVSSPTTNRRPVLKWFSAAGASGYTLQVDTIRAFSPPLFIIPVTDTSYTPTADFPIDTIYWRVKTTFSMFSAASSFIIQDNRIPVLVPYTPKITIETKPTLKWYKVTGATSYTIVIDDNSNFGSPIATVPITDTTYSSINDFSTGYIYWKVKSNLADIYSVPDTLLIVTDSIPFLQRYNGAIVCTRKPTFRWNAVANATSYTIAIADNQYFTGPLLIPVASTAFVPVVNLSMGKQFWRVSCSRNFSLFSPYDSLVIDSASGVLPSEKKATSERLTLKLRNNGFIVNLPNTYTGSTEIALYSMQGRLVSKFSFNGNGVLCVPFCRPIGKGVNTVIIKNFKAGMLIDKIIVE